MNETPGTVVVAASDALRRRIAAALAGRAVVRFVSIAEASADVVDVALPDECGPPELARVVELLARLAAARGALDLAHAGQRRLARLAETDPLTQLANRRAWDDALAAAEGEARTAGRPYCLALVDLDEFKAVNDRHGHAVGDAVLRAVAEGFSAAVRSGDLAARLGGDEFGLLLPGLTADRAVQVLERIRRTAVAQPAERNLPPVTCTLGFATSDAGSVAGPALAAAADEALRRAKLAGRNRIEGSAERGGG